MSDSEKVAKVYKMDEAARALNREAQQRFRLRQRLKKAAARAIGNDMGVPFAPANVAARIREMELADPIGSDMGTPDAGSSPTSPPDAIYPQSTGPVSG